MSKKGDFLSGFSGGSTQKPLTEQEETPVIGEKPIERSKTDKINVAENKKLADKIVANDEKKRNAPVGTPTRPAQNANAIIKAPEHTITKDDKFHKRKMVKYGMIGTISIVGIVAIFFLVRMVTSVELQDWTGEELRRAQEWGMLSNISIKRNDAYSLDYPEGQIISQSHEPGTSLPRGSVLIVTVSLGPDMNEVVPLPDFEEMTRAEIATWRTQNGFTSSSIAISDEASSDVEVNHVIRVDVPSDVDMSNFTRSDRLTIVLSSGPETVKMLDFTNAPNNTREAVETWKAENPLIDVEIIDEPNENVERDVVLGQSHRPQSDLAAGTTVTIRISAGLPIIVPNFADIPRDEAEEVGQEIGLTVNTRSRFSATVPYGHFISQSVEPGYELFGENPSVIVTHSLGRPWIAQISMENDISKTLFEFNSQGARLTHRIDYVDSHEIRGTVVSQSIYNEYVALDAHIVFRVSLGYLTPPANVEPDLPGDGGEPALAPDDDNDDE
jgi:serine/threonine-protein kinase